MPAWITPLFLVLVSWPSRGRDVRADTPRRRLRQGPRARQSGDAAPDDGNVDPLSSPTIIPASGRDANRPGCGLHEAARPSTIKRLCLFRCSISRPSTPRSARRCSTPSRVSPTASASSSAPRSKASNRSSRRTLGDPARDRRVVGHRRAAGRADGARTSAPATRSSPARIRSSPPPAASRGSAPRRCSSTSIPTTFNIDPRRRSRGVHAADQGAIMPVHLFGQSAEHDADRRRVGEQRLPVIEDAAQAIGATYHDRHGRRRSATSAASRSSRARTSARFGDGGLVTTNDAALAHKLGCCATTAWSRSTYHKIVGGNFRLDAMQAAVLRVKLPHLAAWTAGRQRQRRALPRAVRRRGTGRHRDAAGRSGRTASHLQPVRRSACPIATA